MSKIVKMSYFEELGIFFNILFFPKEYFHQIGMIPNMI